MEPLTPLKKTIPQFKCTLNFVYKGLHFIHFSKILRNNIKSSTCPIPINEEEFPMISYSLTKPLNRLDLRFLIIMILSTI